MLKSMLKGDSKLAVEYLYWGHSRLAQNSLRLVADITIDNSLKFEEPIDIPESDIQQNNIQQPPAPGIQCFFSFDNF